MNFLPQPHGCAPCAPSISVRHVRLNEETRPTFRTIIIIRDDSTLTASLVCSNLNRYHCDSDLQIQTIRTVLGPDPMFPDTVHSRFHAHMLPQIGKQVVDEATAVPKQVRRHGW